MQSGFLVTDADNTLWDTNRVFADAQLSILEELEKLAVRSPLHGDRLAYVRSFDQDIARAHGNGLRYPPHLLVEAIADSLGLRSLGKSSIDSIVDEYQTRLTNKPRLRPGVRKTLRELQRNGVEIVVASEGAKANVIRNLEAHKISQITVDLVVGVKTTGFFKTLYQRGGSQMPKVCVGDQLDRDITPAKDAGFTTFYFPGGFRPSWEFDIEARDADFVIRNYTEVKEVFPIRDAA